jgi:FkbM family methyltransferase
MRIVAVRLLARPILQPIHHVLLSLALHGIGVRNYLENRPFGAGEKWFLDAFFRTVGRMDPILFDVGANLGEYSAELVRRSPQAHVYAFEPGPTAYSDIEARFAAQERVHVLNMALGAAPEMRTLYVKSTSPRSPVASFYPRYGVAQKDRTQPVEVTVDTVDEYCARNSIEHIDLLKIDVEGHDFQVLLGARRMLAEKRVSAVQFEFGEMHVHSRNFVRDFIELLDGYRLARLLPKGAAPFDEMPPHLIELFAYQNIIAVRPGTVLARELRLDKKVRA